MSQLKDIFAKDINRYIEGVVKADEADNTLQEIEEYVLTNEIEKKIEYFFEAYCDYEGANGAWISGFFGSGKSHLLKILSYLLENKTVDGQDLAEKFLPKIQDEMLKGNVKKAISIPSKSILFNIDQKADTASEKQLVSVFMKVFNEFQGYCPEVPYVADFEREMDKKGMLEDFISAYEKKTDLEWDDERGIVHGLDNEIFAEVYAEVKGCSEEEALKVLDRFENKYELSIETFASHVKDYIDLQAKGFRLNFFVDEIGQFIADNTELMLNLQTIAETLATKCKGQAWVLVTSQEDITVVTGDMNASQGNDFSKIQGRFKNRVNLTSADVADVIQKRLLEKKPEVEEELNDIYRREQNNFRTLFEFSGTNTRKYKGFTDEEHFLNCYPFIPYQFQLFQASIRGLSEHNAFQGKHRSVGERSMLGVFQDVVKSISDQPMGSLATFDLMFEGIEKGLNSGMQNSINVARSQLEDPFALRVLKALFLVKFVKEFRATPMNLVILLTDQFDLNTAELEKKVKEALNKLEQQTYIQRNGDEYEFLTNEEKDIEAEIKHVELDSTASNDLLVKLIFTGVLKDKKIRYEDNRQDYPFSTKLDDILFGKEHELAINIITPNHEHYNTDIFTIQSRSVDRLELMIVLPEDDKLYADLRLHEQTQKYISLNNPSTTKETTKRILENKSQQNTLRRELLQNQVEDQLASASFYVNGVEIDKQTVDAKTRIQRGFQHLISFAYPKLRLLKHLYTDAELRSILLDQTPDDLKITSENLSEAETEVLMLINRKKQLSERPTLKSVIDNFAKRPNGWYQMGTICIVSELVMRNRIEIKENSNTLSPAEIFQKLSKTGRFDGINIEPLEDFSDASIRALKDLHQEFFNESNAGTDAKDVATRFQEALKSELKVLEDIHNAKTSYPFLDKLEQACSDLRSLSGKEYGYYLKELRKFKDDLLADKEELIDPIKEFWHSKDKRGIYDDVVDYLNTQGSNFTYIEDESTQVLTDLREHNAPYAQNRIQKAKQALDGIKEKVTSKTEDVKKLQSEKVQACLSDLKACPEFSDLDEEQQSKLEAPFQSLVQRIASEKLIAVIMDYERQAEGLFKQQRDEMVRLVAEAQKGDPTSDEPPKPVVQYVDAVDLMDSRGFSKRHLESEADIEDYLAYLKENFRKAIAENKRISL